MALMAGGPPVLAAAAGIPAEIPRAAHSRERSIFGSTADCDIIRKLRHRFQISARCRVMAVLAADEQHDPPGGPDARRTGASSGRSGKKVVRPASLARAAP